MFGKKEADRILNLIKTKKSDYWMRVREKQMLALFHKAADGVPAYKDFLKKNGVEPDKVKTLKDFQLVPPMSKKNYLRQYDLKDLCYGGTLRQALVFTSTSGSTGEPFYFPRNEQLDWQSSIYHELFLRNNSRQNLGQTLVIVGFGMGVWIGGLITFKAFENVAKRGYPISIITPGINKSEIFHALKTLSPNFTETILVGYPPFVKDLIDEAEDNGVNLKKINLRILNAAESYSEKFRDYVVSKSGIKNVYLDMVNIYGTADLGTMAFETPTTIFTRRILSKNITAFNNIFSQITKTPTLAQYNPMFTSFEEESGSILLTGDNSIPLVRYTIGDNGGVMSYKELDSRLHKSGIDLADGLKKQGLESFSNQLPVVYVYERTDLSTKLYGAIIYPEHVREALQDSRFESFLTGKFTMLTRYDDDQNQFLEINVELKPGIKAKKSLEKLCCDTIVKNLLNKNAEYKNNHNSLADEVTPRIIFWPYGNDTYFKSGVKQKWVKNTS
ncbi:MAG: hypothetical protein AAB455_00525 [Patescibacteria group bacterium]